MSRGDLRQAALGAGIFGLSLLPFASKAKRPLSALLRDESGAIRAWHGSPHDFDKFSLDKIGTGEGAQAYGHGLYFAENKGVADGYRNTLAAPKIMGREMRLPESQAWGDLQLFNGDFSTAIDQAELELRAGLSGGRHQLDLEPIEDRLGVLRAWQKHGVPEVTDTGRLYEVNINAEPEDFLDWDAPLSGKAAQLAVPNKRFDIVFDRGPVPLAERHGGISHPDKHLVTVATDQGYVHGLGDSRDAAIAAAQANVLPADGQQLYNNLSTALTGGKGHLWGRGSGQATERLLNAGIPGIRYFDQGSRNAADGTRNYVVFDDSLIDILNKF